MTASFTAAPRRLADLGDSLWPDTGDVLPASLLAAIAALADEADATGRIADESLAGLREAGYFGLPVPSEFEGGGAGLLLSCAAQRALGAADPALAIALNMHLFTLGVMVEHWRRRRDESWVLLEAVAGQRRLVASAFAEPGLNGSILRSNCRARRVEGGYVVSGLKAPCSLAARADLVCLQVQEEGPSGDLLVALAPAGAPGVSLDRTWDSLGMRASESDTLRLDDLFLADRLIFHRTQPGIDYDDVFAAGLVWFCLTTSATYLGLARAALELSATRLRGARVHHAGASRADNALVQAAFGGAVSRLLPLEAACAGLASAADATGADLPRLLPAALALKSNVARAGADCVQRGIELAGASAYARGTLTRLWRDVQAARFHPPTLLATDQILGRWALGLPFTFELSDGSPVRAPL